VYNQSGHILILSGLKLSKIVSTTLRVGLGTRKYYLFWIEGTRKYFQLESCMVYGREKKSTPNIYSFFFIQWYLYFL